jgi:hypothetical protein
MIATVADSTNVAKPEGQVQQLGTRIEGDEIAHSGTAPAGSVMDEDDLYYDPDDDDVSSFLFMPGSYPYRCSFQDDFHTGKCAGGDVLRGRDGAIEPRDG